MVEVVPPAVLRALGERVRERRQVLGISQERLAERAGLHRNYIGGIEQGRRNVALVNLVKLALALECDLADLVAGIHEAGEVMTVIDPPDVSAD